MRILTQDEMKLVSGGDGGGQPIDEIIVVGVRITVEPMTGHMRAMLMMGNTDGGHLANEHQTYQDAPQDMEEESGQEVQMTAEQQEALEELFDVLGLSEAERQIVAENLDLIAEALSLVSTGSESFNLAIGDAETASLISKIGLLSDAIRVGQIGTSFVDAGVTMQEMAEAIGFIAGVLVGGAAGTGLSPFITPAGGVLVGAAAGNYTEQYVTAGIMAMADNIDVANQGGGFLPPYLGNSLYWLWLNGQMPLMPPPIPGPGD